MEWHVKVSNHQQPEMREKPFLTLQIWHIESIHELSPPLPEITARVKPTYVPESWCVYVEVHV